MERFDYFDIYSHGYRLLQRTFYVRSIPRPSLLYCKCLYQMNVMNGKYNEYISRLNTDAQHILKRKKDKDGHRHENRQNVIRKKKQRGRKEVGEITYV